MGLRVCRVPAPDEVAERIVWDLRRMGYGRAVFVAHSYGTFVLARVLKRFPERVHNVVMLDPAAILLAAPDLLYNFIYKGPCTDSWAAFSKDAVKAVCQRDPGLAATMCRKFYWHALNLWPEDIPAGAVVFVAGRDALLPSGAIVRMLEMFGRHVDLVYDPDAEHAHAPLHVDEFMRAVNAMRKWMPAAGAVTAGGGTAGGGGGCRRDWDSSLAVRGSLRGPSAPPD